MLWIRDRSGRSGRRRGSQKPGMTKERGSAALVSPAALAGADGVPASSMPTAHASGHDSRAR